ncbi:hypothetical protein ACFSJY_05715 [Thalassotalea euphylliae]|uniref:hypothetical protein n=1 Tax=Thalassotalea euphylliae TaxID=1655234 RepID=UPI003632256E
MVKQLYSLIAIILFQSAAIAAESDSPQTKQEETKDVEKFVIQGSMEQAEIDWFESLHANVSETVFRSAYWFDGFFTDDDTSREQPDINARIRLAWEPKARDFEEFDTKFRLRVKLPHLTDKVDLILSDDEEDEIRNLPLETVNDRPTSNDDTFAAAVRFVHHRGDDEVTDTRLGIASGDVFTRARYKRRFAWHEKHAFRFEPSIYYFIQDGVGARLMLEYDYQLGLRDQFRFNYSIRGSEDFSGIRWKHGFYHLHQFSLLEAGALGLVVQGERNGDEGFLIDKYTLSYRYRFNAIKKWLYFEVEPFLEWPEEENYSTTPGIALRVEGFFYKN